jgi:hypothetical protein
MASNEKPHENQFVELSISTTAGFYPMEGFERVPVHQKISVLLSKAQKELKITDVAGWITTFTDGSGKRQIDAERSYLDNGLSGKVEIDWGPSEGGGG